MRTLSAHQARATIEHIVGVNIVRTIQKPTATHIDGSQVTAATENVRLVFYLVDVEAAQVKHRQARAILEHGAHSNDLGGVEVAHVKRSQTRAILEHAVHISDLGGVEVTHVKA